mmetsp:Transcript_13631/g.29224  ORF Transcript_13631/g.29224 Transcript_13631/m.29224 type:complete len:512 (-) Transcript_13631:704-2239(-)|eukprot:CAMPEP_0202897808 /NCGR_PEP_ID=MMETSP1392-20130828/6486_1 /ASSEMBLY_ACC=CAM_ASM_000868 /TAXON_ID=225041 /ORGANISM="Chlamydomonas chlamydogama, Strain SAG 11-48b" /LENGTH=511 /DNA_ID=CAMNT_0049583557 /DNA_START=100 /DNA_END=1635 /DNA_ORIENTATION=-
MFCAVSGNVPEQPVVSSKSGHLFERHLVEKYVKETGKCPVTGESLSLDDLLPLKTNKAVKPRAAPAASIPGLLGMFHDEWDALMLETHSLRQNMHTVRQELSHALYQHDAACRVIARLIRERDEAQAALQNVRATLQAEIESGKQPAPASQEPAEDEQNPAKRAKKANIPEEVLEELTNVNQTLSKSRKKRAVSESLATAEELATASVLSSHPLHKTTTGGIVCIDINPYSASTLATAGLDGTAQIFDYAAGRVISSLEGHSKRLTSVAYATSSVLLTTSADKTTRIWSTESGSYNCTATLKEHTSEVVGVTVHPSRKYFVTGSADASWCFYDLASTTCLKQVTADDAKEGYSVVQFHPDGLILGTGTETSLIRIWEVKQQKNVATFEGHAKPLKALAFSENGYHLASCSEDCVKLWDLRKLKNFKTLEPYDGAACNTLAFDFSGMYLAVGGADARIYGQKQDWSVVKTFPDMPKKGVTALRFGTDARTLFVGSADHNLRVIGVQGAAMQE